MATNKIKGIVFLLLLVLIGSLMAFVVVAASNPYITNYYATKSSYEPGDRVKIYYTVYNPGSSRYLGLGATIYKPTSGYYNDENDDTNKYFYGYSSTTRYRYFDIPSYAPSGWYDLAVGIHNVASSSGSFNGMLDFEKDYNAFEVEEEFDPPYIDDIGVVSGYGEVMAGDRVKVFVDIYNPSDVNLNTDIDYKVKSPSGTIYTGDDDVTIDKNGMETVYEYIDIPSNAETGWYKLRVEIEDDESSYSFSDTKGYESNAFRVLSSFSNPTITNYRLSKTRVDQGESFTIYCTINNPNQDDVSAWLGATFKDPFGRVVEDSSNDKNILLSPGSREYSRTFVMPSTATTGTYSIFLGVHGRNGYDFATYYGYYNYALTVESSFSDPSISSFSISPRTRNPGQEFTISYTINNPNSNNVDVSLGATIYDPNNNHYDDGSNDVDRTTLSPGTNYKSRDFRVPSSAPAGAYDVQVGIHKAVFNGRYDEYKWKYNHLTVEQPFSDPYISTYRLSKTTVASGESFTIYYTINNPNSYSVDAWLGATFKDPFGRVVEDKNNDKNIVLNSGSREYSRTFVMPSTAMEGTYSIFLGVHGRSGYDFVDYEGYHLYALTVDNPFSEPQLQSFSFSPSSLDPMGEFTITYTINNPNNYNVDVSLGATIRDAFNKAYNDEQNDVRRTTLTPGTTTKTRKFKIPFNAIHGTYDIQTGIHKAEFDGAYGNYLWKYDELTVRNLFTEPYVESFDFSPKQANPGDEITITYYITNPNAYVYDVSLGATIYDEDNNDYNDEPNDIDRTTLALGNNQKTRKFTIPSDAPPGEYDIQVGIHKAVFDGELGDYEWKYNELTVSGSDDPVLQEYGLTKSTIKNGETINVWYKINNPKSNSVEVGLGSTFRDENFDYYNNEANDIYVDLDPGVNTVSRKFYNADMGLGTYDAAFAIHWVDSQGAFNGMIDSSDPFYKEDVLTIEPAEGERVVHPFELEIEDAGSTTKIYKQPGDYVSLKVTSSETQDLVLWWPFEFILEDDLSDYGLLSLEKDEETFVKFLIPTGTSTGIYQFYVEDKDVSVEVTDDPLYVAITDRERLFDRYDGDSKVYDLLETAYEHASRKHGIIYYLENYDIKPDGEIADKDVSNDYVEEISVFVQTKSIPENVYSVIILGDDSVVPHYKRDIPETLYDFQNQMRLPDSKIVKTDNPFIPIETATLAQLDSDFFFSKGRIQIIIPDSMSKTDSDITNLKQALKDKFGGEECICAKRKTYNTKKSDNSIWLTNHLARLSKHCQDEYDTICPASLPFSDYRNFNEMPVEDLPLHYPIDFRAACAGNCNVKSTDDITVWHSNEVGCNSFEDLDHSTLIIVGNMDNNRATQCLPWVTNSAVPSLTIQKNVWDGTKNAILINADIDDSRDVIHVFTYIIGEYGSWYKILEHSGGFTVIDGAKIGLSFTGADTFIDAMEAYGIKGDCRKTYDHDAFGNVQGILSEIKPVMCLIDNVALIIPVISASWIKGGAKGLGAVDEIADASKHSDEFANLVGAYPKYFAQSGEKLRKAGALNNFIDEFKDPDFIKALKSEFFDSGGKLIKGKEAEFKQLLEGSEIIHKSARSGAIGRKLPKLDDFNRIYGESVATATKYKNFQKRVGKLSDFFKKVDVVGEMSDAELRYVGELLDGGFYNALAEYKTGLRFSTSWNKRIKYLNVESPRYLDSARYVPRDGGIILPVLPYKKDMQSYLIKHRQLLFDNDITPNQLFKIVGEKSESYDEFIAFLKTKSHDSNFFIEYKASLINNFLPHEITHAKLSLFLDDTSKMSQDVLAKRIMLRGERYMPGKPSTDYHFDELLCDAYDLKYFTPTQRTNFVNSIGRIGLDDIETLKVQSFHDQFKFAMRKYVNGGEVEQLAYFRSHIKEYDKVMNTNFVSTFDDQILLDALQGSDIVADAADVKNKIIALSNFMEKKIYGTTNDVGLIDVVAKEVANSQDVEKVVNAYVDINDEVNALRYLAY